MALQRVRNIPYELLVRWGTDVKAVLNRDTGKYELQSGHVGQHVAYMDVVFDDETGEIINIKQDNAVPVSDVVDNPGKQFPLSDVLNDVQQNALKTVDTVN